MIAIIDYDMGNVASVANMLKRIGAPTTLTRDPEILKRASKVIIPGVGAFDKGMQNLASFGLIDALHEAATVRKIPVLGICLGMQLMTRSSEEGAERGLGWIEARTCRFRFPENTDLKIPHMGWNETAAQRDNALLPAESRSRFYFVHGYFVKCERPDDVLATTQYGIEFASAVGHENIFGVQFHPEKSHRFGLELLQRFAAL